MGYCNSSFRLSCSIAHRVFLYIKMKGMTMEALLKITQKSMYFKFFTIFRKGYEEAASEENIVALLSSFGPFSDTQTPCVQTIASIEIIFKIYPTVISNKNTSYVARRIRR